MNYNRSDLSPLSAIRASLLSTFNADYAKATPYSGGGGGSTGGGGGGGGSTGPAQCSVTASHAQRIQTGMWM